jgi:hypothetical protein
MLDVFSTLRTIRAASLLLCLLELGLQSASAAAPDLRE